MKNYSVIHLVVFMFLLPLVPAAQVAINSVSTINTIIVPGGTSSQLVTSHSSSVNGVTPSTNYSVNYTNVGNIKIVDFSYSGKTYVRYSLFDTIIIRRAANASEPTNGNKQHIFCEGPAAIDNITHIMPFTIAYPQVSGYAFMEQVMKEGYINRGSDNVFNNDASSDLTFNNIERVDFVYKPGIAATNAASAGFLIAERGGNDAFKIAAITAVDASGNPAAFGSVLSVTTSSYGSAIASAATYVMRKDVSDNVLRPFSLVPSQPIKSVFIRLSDLGISANQAVYGYALMGSDVTATTSAQVLAYTNSTYYPTTTTSATGGMDLASAPGIFETDHVLAIHSLTAKTLTNDNEAVLEWTDDDHSLVKEYQLEKSLNGTDFETIGHIASGNVSAYSFTDKNFTVSAYYRVRVILLTGSIYYSEVMLAKHSGTSFSVSLYPNPAHDYLVMAFTAKARNRQVTLFSDDGRERGKWQINENSLSAEIDLRQLGRGHYFVNVSDPVSGSKTSQFVKQ
ncbi:MAG: T9SS type A sorting domain-containing protein [Chitinophagaceae bacterium]